MEKPETSKYWLDTTVADILSKYHQPELIVSSGIAPSASYHIGHFREVLTADALAWGLRRAGKKVRHLHFVDNFDPLRKRYDFLPESYEEYVGWPICLIPDPHGDCHDSYAAHYAAEFQENAVKMGVEMEVIYSYQDQYQNGKMAVMIDKVLGKADIIREILKARSNRELPADWTPVQVMKEGNTFINATIDEWDQANKTIAGVSYATGKVKLNWRLDWPARWALHGVQVEPFGKELATKGGSYDTGAEFVRQVFDSEPPYPLTYDTINLVGDNKKMSSSLGNLVTPAQALEIMPPEILRYFVLRSVPKRVLYFDSGLGLYNLIEEYSKVEKAVLVGEDHEFADAYRIASAISGTKTIASVPFSHLVAVYQAALGKPAEVFNILARTGYQEAAETEKAVLRREFEYVHNWLEEYAPEGVKFAVQDGLPDVSGLSDDQKSFLAEVAVNLEGKQDLDGQAMHELVYAAKEKIGLKPGEAFKAIYQVILGKSSGPKAGWFLASLDRNWLIKRLKLESK